MQLVKHQICLQEAMALQPELLLAILSACMLSFTVLIEMP
jgi:hypothetical protein